MKEDTDTRAKLTALITDADLGVLEGRLADFNIFDAIGVRNQELRHSSFLAFLLDPRENHGLGLTFTKRLLMKAVVSAPGGAVSVGPIDIDVWDLTQMSVTRETEYNIDILLKDNTNRLAVIIENKIGSSEHSDQLQRYWQYVDHQYPNWKVIGIYLTPDNDQPSDDRYIPIGYDQLAEMLSDLVKGRSITLNSDVQTVVTHYVQMIRRYIVNEDDIAELCRRIYAKHKPALDLIYEYRQDRQSIVRQTLETVIGQIPYLVIDHASKGAVRFFPEEWDVQPLMKGQGWTQSGRMLLFEFGNRPDDLSLRLYLGPGPQETREKLFEMVQQGHPPFKPAYKTLYPKWNHIYARKFIDKKMYESADDEEIKEKIEREWDSFVASDLKAIRARLQETFAALDWQ